MLNDQELAVLQQIATALDLIADRLSVTNAHLASISDALEINYGSDINQKLDTLNRLVGDLRR